MKKDFDFLTDAPEPTEPEVIEPEYVGPNLSTAAKMTPRKFASSVLDVYEKLGGASWLLTQAKADAKAFLELLKKLIPKSVQLDDLAGLNVTLIDQFGNKVEINSGVQGLPSPAPTPGPVAGGDFPASGQRQIATSGNPPSSDSSDPEKETPTIDITEVFE